ncbi:hypothetical protein [Nostoc sp.]
MKNYIPKSTSDLLVWLPRARESPNDMAVIPSIERKLETIWLMN